jgi:hypothetical protein
LEYWHYSILLTPVIALFFFALCIPVVMAVRRWMPEGRLKRFLLWNTSGKRGAYAAQKSTHLGR